MLKGEALSELDMITGKSAYEAWEHLKTKYKPKDDKAYASLEMKFAQCELESPGKNPEKWINELIRINNRIANCHSTQKKSDVMMIAHVLSKLLGEEKYYKNFIAMTRRFGYSTQTIREFKKELYDYWENNIKQEDEDQESDGEAYATYERAGNGAKKLGKKPEAKGEETKQYFQNSGNKEQPQVTGRVIWTQTGPMVVPMGMMGQGHDSTIIKDSMSELVIMELRPTKMDGTAATSGNKQYAYVPLEMLQEMMKGNQVNSIQAQNYVIPGQDPNGRKQRPKCSNCGRDGHTKENCFAKGGGKEGQWPARNLNDVKCFRCNKNRHFARDCKEAAPSVQNPDGQQQQVNNTQKEEDKFNFFIGSTIEEQVNKPDDEEVKEESDEWINYAGSKTEEVEEFLIDSGATCHVTYKDQGLQNRSPSKSMVYMGDETKAAIEATGDLSLKVCNTDVMLNLNPVHYVPRFKKHISFLFLDCVRMGMKSQLQTRSAGLRL